MPLIRCTNVFYKGDYPVTLLPHPRRLAPSLGLGTTWVRQPRSGSCHYPTAATKCNVQPRRATANPVGGKACSSTKGGSLRNIPNTYSIHKVSSFKFAYFQGRLSRHITSPSEKTRPGSWPGDYIGKATPVWQLSTNTYSIHKVSSLKFAYFQGRLSRHRYNGTPTEISC